MNRKPGRGKDAPAAYACTSSREWPWFLLTVHKEQGEHLGCGLKARNKPAQRQRGQHKDIFPCIARHNRGHEMHESSHTHNANPDLVKETHMLCFVSLVLVFAWRQQRGTACECDELSSPCIALGANGNGTACGPSSCLVVILYLSMRRCT